MKQTFKILILSAFSIGCWKLLPSYTTNAQLENGKVEIGTSPSPKNQVPEPISAINPEKRNSLVSARSPLISTDSSQNPTSSTGASDKSDSPADNDNSVDKEFDSNDVEEEMDKFQSVYETWKQERTDFYREELELNESEIDWLNRLEERAATEIENIVKLMENENNSLMEDTTQKSIQSILDSYENDVSKLMGTDKIAKLKQFRDSYNAEIDSRFESRSQIVGF